MISFNHHFFWFFWFSVLLGLTSLFYVHASQPNPCTDYQTLKTCTQQTYCAWCLDAIIQEKTNQLCATYHKCSTYMVLHMNKTFIKDYPNISDKCEDFIINPVTNETCSRDVSFLSTFWYIFILLSLFCSFFICLIVIMKIRWLSVPTSSISLS